MLVPASDGHSFLLAVLVCSVIVAINGQAIGPYMLHDPFQISRVVFDRSRSQLPPDLIFGARECGGSGKVLLSRHENCVSSKPCYLVIGRKDDANIVFIPNENINDVVIRETVISSDGKFTTTDVPMPSVNLVAGLTYQFTTSELVLSENEGYITIRIEIFSQRNYLARTCLEAVYSTGFV